MKCTECLILFNQIEKRKRSCIRFVYLIVARGTMNYCTHNAIVVINERDMGGRQFCNKVGVSNGVDNFLHTDVPGKSP